MAEKKKGDLTAEELLKKLRENFGEDATVSRGEQMTLEETAAIQNKRKVFRYKKVEPVADEEPEEPDDGISERLARSIANAERYVGTMHFKDDGAQDEQPVDEEPIDGEPVDEEPVYEEPVDEEPVDEESIDEEPVDEEPAVDAPEEEEDLPEAPAENEAPKEPSEEKTPDSDGREALFVQSLDEDQPVEEQTTDQSKLPTEDDETSKSDAPDGDAEEEGAREPEEELFETVLTPAVAPDGADGTVKSDFDELFAKKDPAPNRAEDAADEASDKPEEEDPDEPEEEALDEPEEEALDESAEEALDEPEEEALDEPEEEALDEPEEETFDESEEETFDESEEEALDEPEEEALDEPEEEALDEPEDTEREDPLGERRDEEKPEGQSEAFGEEDEAQFMAIFGMDKELEKKFGKEKAGKLTEDLRKEEDQRQVGEEYESPAQNEKFFERFRKNYKNLTWRTVIALIALALVFVFEALPDLISGGRQAIFGVTVARFLSNPVYAALVNMQITMLLAAIGYKEVLAGFRSVGNGRSTPEIFLSLSVVLTLVYEGGMLYCHSVNARFFNLPLAFAVCLALFYARTQLKRNLLSFKIVSSRKTKYAIMALRDEERTLEKEAFGTVASNDGVYGVQKTKFVSGFASRSVKEPRFMGSTGILATVVVVIALVFFLLGFYLSKEPSAKLKVMSAFCTAMLATLFCMPVSALISLSLPFYKASRKAFDMDSAIIGGESLEQYADATVISFEDKDIFPAKNVHVRSLKLYEDSRIDHVLFGVASLFHKLGGPLDDVFAVATRESGITEDVDILEIDRDGVEAAVKGVSVFVGSSAFMRKRDLLSGVSEEDEALEMEGRIRIMYVAIGRELSAKMYIEYAPDKDFKSIMASLYRSGMCVGIRTLDPNIDDRMMRRHVDLSKYPVKILRMEKASEETVRERVDSGIVSKGSAKGLLKTLSFCRKVLQVVRASTVIKIVSIILGAALTALILVMTALGKLDGAYVVSSFWTTVYQLCFAALAAVIALLFA